MSCSQLVFYGIQSYPPFFPPTACLYLPNQLPTSYHPFVLKRIPASSPFHLDILLPSRSSRLAKFCRKIAEILLQSECASTLFEVLSATDAYSKVSYLICIWPSWFFSLNLRHTLTNLARSLKIFHN